MHVLLLPSSVYAVLLNLNPSLNPFNDNFKSTFVPKEIRPMNRACLKQWVNRIGKLF